MRESLTVLAMLLIVVLTTALVGPYFVDWNAQRARIEARLSTLLGADVAIAGPLDVKLLPRPIFRMQDVTVRGLTPRAGTATAARVDLELSLTALLRGEVSFVDADIAAPTVTLPLDGSGAVALPRLGEGAADRVNLVHLGLRDGTLRFTRPDGQVAASLGGITGTGEAESLAGPFRFNGRFDTPRGALAARVATGMLENRRLRIKVGIEPGGPVPRTDIEGVVTAGPGPGEAVGLALDGTVTLSGARALGTGGAAVPWRLAGALHAVPGRAELGNGELRAGVDGRGLIATVTGEADLGDRPALRLAMKSRQADLGRLAVQPDAPVDANRNPVPASLADDVALLGALGADADLTAGLPLPVTLDLAAETVVAGGLTFGDLAGRLTLQANRPVAGTLSLAAADGSQLSFDGSFEPGPAAVYKGRIEASSNHLGRFAASLQPELPDVAAAIRTALPVDAFRFAGAVDLSGIGVAARDVALSLDRSRFAGTVTLTRAVGPDRARLFADLTSDALDLDALPDWRDTARAAAGLDVSLTLVARATRLAATDTGAVEAGRIALDLKKAGDTVTLDRLSLADIGGATAEVKGRSDGRTAHAEGRLDARRLNDLLTLVDRVAPALVTDSLLARADALSPALLRVSADAAFGPDGTLAPTALALDGTVAATSVTLRLRPDGAPPAAGGTGALPFAVDLTLGAAEAGTLLRQAGLRAGAGSAVGPGRIEGSARRDASGGLAGSLTATLGPTTLTVAGSGDAAASTAKVVLRSANLAPLGRALQVANPEPSASWPAEAAATLSVKGADLKVEGLAGTLAGTPFNGTLAGRLPFGGSAEPATPAAPVPVTGALSIARLPLAAVLAPVIGPLPPARPGALWSDAPLTAPVLLLPPAELHLSAAALPLAEGVTLGDARATLRLAPGAVTLADLSAGLAGGRVGGTVTVRRDGAAASLAGHVDWRDLPVASPAFAGRSRATLELAGTGNSVAATMASLAGSGTVSLTDARLPRFDPAAIRSVVAVSDAAGATVDEATVADQLSAELDRGALSLGDVTFPVTVAAGVLRSDTVRATGPGAEVAASGTLDLRNLGLTLRATASLANPPKDWTGAAPQAGVLWKGPFASPARVVDAGALVNGIAARAIARDQARIEAFQEDIRERAFFARRLRAIEAEQKAARDKARADADAAERQRLQDMLQGAMDAPPLPPLAPPRPPPGAPLPPKRPGAPAARGLN